MGNSTTFRISPRAEALKRQIKDMWAEGLSATQIGDCLGISRCSVLGHVFRMDLPPRAAPRLKQAIDKKSPRPKAMPKPKPPAPEGIEPRNMDLMAISDSTCRWPYGDGPYTFCGHTPDDKSPYCEFHTRLAYPPRQVRDAA